MTKISLICLFIMALSWTPARGESLPPNPAPAAGTSILLPEPGAVRTTVTGMLCPTENGAARVLYNSAIEQQKEGKVDQAREAYLKAVEKDPKYCDAMDNLGQLLRSQGEVTQAISWYRRSLAVKPDNAVAHQNLASAYALQGETDKAVTEYRWLVANDADNPEGFYGLGKIYLETERGKDAIVVLLRAAELYRRNASPLLSDAYYLLAVAYYTIAECRKTREYLEIIYPEVKENPNANLLLGICYLEPPQADLGKAKQYLQKAQELGAKIPAEVRLKLGGE